MKYCNNCNQIVSHEIHTCQVGLLPPPIWWEKLLERLEDVQGVINGEVITGEELECAYNELDDIIKIVRDGLNPT